MSRIITHDELAEFHPSLPVAIQQRFGVEPNGEPLATDGIIGPKTKGAEYLDPTSIEHPLVACAVGEAVAGAREFGHNEGEWVIKYMGHERWEGGSWCAGFVSWCLDQVYGDTPYIRGARRLVDAMIEEKGRVAISQIEAGDVLAWERESSVTNYAGHIGIVSHVSDEYVYTIEGNATPEGRVRVFRYEFPGLERAGQPVWGVGRWEK